MAVSLSWDFVTHFLISCMIKDESLLIRASFVLSSRLADSDNGSSGGISIVRDHRVSTCSLGHRVETVHFLVV
jgi:hypothetical protein